MTVPIDAGFILTFLNIRATHVWWSCLYKMWSIAWLQDPGCDPGWRREADMCYMVSPAKINHGEAEIFCLRHGEELARMIGRNVLFLRSLSTAEGMWIASPPNYQCYSMTTGHSTGVDCSTKLQAICWKQASQP